MYGFGVSDDVGSRSSAIPQPVYPVRMGNGAEKYRLGKKDIFIAA
jgi:hypothetical protein